MYDGVSQFALLALPLFVLVGELLSRCQITEKLVEVAKHVAGWAIGGLAHVNIVASMFFAGISGSVLADTASIGPLLIPAMVRERFSPAFSAAVTASSSVIGAIIPPSVLMIVLGGHLEISVGALFAAGIVPGILVGVFLMFTAFVISMRRGYGIVHPFEGFVSMTRASAKAFPALVIPIWILGGILSGVFTPTEAGAIAVLYTIVISAFYYRTLTLQVFYDALVSGVRVTATVMFIVATAIVFSHLLAFNRVPQEMLKVLLALSDSKILIILIVLGLLMAVGTFLEVMPNMLILGPLLMPVMVDGLGMHPIQYAMMLIVGLLMGHITPPVGLTLFIAAPIARVSLEEVSVAVIPFLVAEVFVLFLIAFVPAVTLTIPRMVGLI